MLVLTRYVGEKIKIGDDVTIEVVESHRGATRIGITAPRDVRILREELAEEKPTTIRIGVI